MLRGLLMHLPSASAFAFTIVVGYLASLAHVPLAWMLGPLVAAACISIAGVPLDPHPNLRRLGQIGIGVAVGLNLTASVLVELTRWLPLMIVSAIFSVILSCFNGAFLARYALLDTKTAFYASLPGGLAEMANIAVRVGARPEAIAIVQTLRVALVVMILPPALIMLEPALAAAPLAGEPIPLVWVLPLVAGGALSACVLGLARLNNPFMIGALLFTGVIVSAGLVAGRMPRSIFSGAQLLLGFAIGARFRREMLVGMPRVTVVGLVSIMGFILAMGIYGAAISPIGGLGLEAALLATSPGGLSEVAVTAQVLHLAVPTIVGFQVVRSVFVNAFASHYFTLFTRIGLIPLLERTIGRPRRPD